MALEGGIAPRIALVDVVTGLLDKGTVINGQATVSLAGVDLVHVALNLLVTSVETLRGSTGAPGTGPTGSGGLGPTPETPLAAGGGAAPSTALITSAPPASRTAAARGGQVLVAEPLLATDAPADTTDQGLAGLVLALVELIRQLLERQAVRRMEGGALTEDEVERMGRALMELNAKMKELFAVFGLDEADVNLDLGPLGQIL